jgi:TetR/AcrR family transcriptional regulator, regulator of mycofactocin system
MVDMPGDEAPTLRERNKARARAEIAAAALDLFSKKGFQGVTIEEIVDAAGVSRRTFFRYFETKEDALLADYPELNLRLTKSLVEGASGDPLDGVRTGLHYLAAWYEERSEAVMERSRVIRDAVHPSARNLEFLSQWESAIASSIAGCLGADPGGLVPRTVGATVVGAFRAALTQWVRSSCREDLHSLLDRALDVVWRGLESELHPAAATGESY